MKLIDPWEFVKRFTKSDPDSWTVEDWADFHAAIDIAMNKIAIRHGFQEKDKDEAH